MKLRREARTHEEDRLERSAFGPHWFDLTLCVIFAAAVVVDLTILVAALVF